jgi:hypothetical protein
MSLTSQINLSIGIDCVGHAQYYDRLFCSMLFTCTALTFSGLRRMWRKKEYGRMYSGKKKVRLLRWPAARTKMENGVKKMIDDAKAGRGYASGIRVRGEEEDDVAGESPARKKVRHNNPLTNTQGCKCGATDHKRVTSSCCPWKGLSKIEVKKNYEKRMREQVVALPQVNRLRPQMVVPILPLGMGMYRSLVSSWRNPPL